MNTRVKPSALAGVKLIVKRELGQYLSTWSGYVIAAAMLLVSGLLFNVHAIGSSPRYSADVLSDLFFDMSGIVLVGSVLIAMRLIAEERANGTLPLLSGSSLTDGQVVIAKYLSAVAFMAGVLLLSLYLPALVVYSGKVSAGHVFAGYLGLMLLASVAVSISVFGSCLVKSQLVAGIIAGVLIVPLLLMWMLARVVEGPLGDVVGYLALHDKHFRPFMDGNVSTSNVVFYLSVTAFFLVLSRNVLEGRRWRA